MIKKNYHLIFYIYSPDQVQCQCGYTHGEHTSRAKASLNQTKRWDSATHSTQKTTNAFGEMEFVGYGGNVGRVRKGFEASIEITLTKYIEDNCFFLLIIKIYFGVHEVK